MKVRANGAYQRPWGSVNVGGVWKPIEQGWVRVAGQWRIFQRPLAYRDVGITLSQYTINGQYDRRSFLRTGNGPAVGGTPGPANYGAMDSYTYVLNGVSREIRGVETGADPITGDAYQWVSLQWFGNVPPEDLAQLILLNGVKGYGVSSSYQTTQDMTFMTYRLERAVQMPVGQRMTISF